MQEHEHECTCMYEEALLSQVSALELTMQPAARVFTRGPQVRHGASQEEEPRLATRGVRRLADCSTLKTAAREVEVEVEMGRNR